MGYEVVDAKRKVYHKKNFILSHEPMITNKGEFKPGCCTINLHGHTHATTNFTEGFPLMYHIGVDSHNGYPVSLDKIIKEIDAHWKNLEMRYE